MEDTIKYYDVNDNEIQESDIDYSLGYLEYETKVIKHHEAQVAQPEENHYEVAAFYFEDGTSLQIKSQNDPHIMKTNPEKGIFGYADQGENKILRGIDLKTVVDKKAVSPREAWDETESFYRYIPYTSEEVAQKKVEKEKQEQQQEFLAKGPERLSAAEINVESLGIDIGDLSVTLVEILENL